MTRLPCSRNLPFVLLLLTGCSSNAPPLVPREHGENLGHLLTAYVEAVQTLQRPPNHLDELRPFLQKLGNPEQIVVSPHDGQPYEIVWGVDPWRMHDAGSGDPQPPLIAHERTGANGVRYVATSMGVFRMTEHEFEQARRAFKKP